MSEQPPSRKLSRRTFNWLETESRLWVETGTLDEAARARILSRYDTESLPHRGTMALTLIAVLMCAIGVLLVIGYNWDRISATVKVVMIMASVAAAFGEFRDRGDVVLDGPGPVAAELEAVVLDAEAVV